MVAGASYLDRNGCLVDAIDDGIDTGPWRRLVKHLAKHASSGKLRVEVQRPEFRGKPTIDDIFDWIAGSLGEGAPVLAALGDYLDHYTVLAAIDPAKLHFFDSASCKFVLRTSCGVGSGRHRLSPKALLRLKVRRRD